jgi:hypothetical protein
VFINSVILSKYEKCSQHSDDKVYYYY